MGYVRDGIYMVSIKPIAELAYPCSDLFDVLKRVKGDDRAALGAPYQTGLIPCG